MQNMFDITHSCSVDATVDKGQIGRLMNHSRKLFNVLTELTEVEGQPRLYFVAAKDICTGTEMFYDYGDRDKDALKAHPWLGN